MTPETKAQAVNVGVPANRLTLSRALDDDAAVASELRQLDLSLLAEEVQQLREQVEVTLRENSLTSAQTHPIRTYGGKVPLRQHVRRIWPAARAAFSVFQASPESRASLLPAARFGRAIRSIDIDAVVQRYEKAKVSSKEYSAELQVRKMS